MNYFLNAFCIIHFYWQLKGKLPLYLTCAGSTLKEYNEVEWNKSEGKLPDTIYTRFDTYIISILDRYSICLFNIVLWYQDHPWWEPLFNIGVWTENLNPKGSLISPELDYYREWEADADVDIFYTIVFVSDISTFWWMLSKPAVLNLI